MPLERGRWNWGVPESRFRNTERVVRFLDTRNRALAEMEPFWMQNMARLSDSPDISQGVSDTWRQRFQQQTGAGDVTRLQSRAFDTQPDEFRREFPSFYDAGERLRGERYAIAAVEQGYPFERERLGRYRIGATPGAATYEGPDYRIFSPEQRAERLAFVQQRVGSLGPGGDKLIEAGVLNADDLNAIERGDPNAFQDINDTIQEMRQRAMPGELRTLERLSHDPDVQEFLRERGETFTKSRQAMSPVTGPFEIALAEAGRGAETGTEKLGIDQYGVDIPEQVPGVGGAEITVGGATNIGTQIALATATAGAGGLINRLPASLQGAVRASLVTAGAEPSRSGALTNRQVLEGLMRLADDPATEPGIRQAAQSALDQMRPSMAEPGAIRQADDAGIPQAMAQGGRGATAEASEILPQAVPPKKAAEYRRYLRELEKERAKAPPPPTETITPSEDTIIGRNAAGETLYERADGSRYRMRFDSPNTRPNGYPDFGGDLRSVTDDASYGPPDQPLLQNWQSARQADISPPPARAPEQAMPSPPLGRSEAVVGPKRGARWQRGSMESTVAAAQRMESDSPLYIAATREGFTINPEPPPFGQQHAIVHPGGAVERVASRSEVAADLADVGRTVTDAGKYREFAIALRTKAKDSPRAGRIAGAMRAGVSGTDELPYRRTEALIDAATEAGLGPDDIRAAAREIGAESPLPQPAPGQALDEVAQPGSLASVADDAEEAAEQGLELPPIGGGTGTPLGQARIPTPQYLKSIDEIAQDIRRSTQTAAGALARGAGKVPPVRTLVETVNPQALVEAPPAGLVDELGEEGARNLQAQLFAHQRKVDMGNSLAGSIEDAVRQRARQVGLTVQDMRVTSVRGVPTVGDLFEKPAKYNLTTAQRRFINDVQGVLDDMHAGERLAGVKKGEIYSDEGRYFPRLVREVRGTENLRADVKRIVGGTQGFQRERFYQTMQEGIDNGVRYEDDIAAIVGTRIRAGVKAASDAELGTLVRPLGRTYKAPKRTPQIGEMGTMIPVVSGRAFPRETAIEIMNRLDPKPPGAIIGAVDTVNSLIRPIMATGDLSASGIQLLPVIARNPAAFAKALGYQMDALLLDGRMMGRYVQANADRISKYVADGGLWNANEFSFDQAKRLKVLSGVIDKGFGRFNSAFNAGVNVGALEVYKGMMGVGDSLGSRAFKRITRAAFGNIKGETSGEIAASIANKMTGRMSSAGIGLKAQQRAIEGATLFAPRFYRAMFGLLGDALQGGMRGAEARRVIAGLVTAGVATHMAASYLLGQEPKLDPRNSNFLTVNLRGNKIGIGGPIYGLLRAGAEVYENPGSTKKVFSMDNPAMRWARGRAAPALSLSVDMIAGETYMGDKLDSPTAILSHIGTSVLPFSAQALIEEGLEAAVPQFLGLRAFPESAGDTFKAAFERKFGHEYGSQDLDSRLAKNDPELASMYEKYQGSLEDFIPEVGEEREERQAELESSGLLSALAPGQEKGFKQRYYEYLSATAPAANEDLPEAQNALLREYWSMDPYNGDERWTNADRTIDQDAYNVARKKVRDQMDEATIDRLYMPKVFAQGQEGYEREVEFLKADRLNDDLADVAKWKGLDSEGEEDIAEFEAFIAENRREDEELRDAEDRLYRRFPNGRELMQWRRDLDSEKRRPELLSEEYISYLIDNERLLRTWYPDNYSAGYVQDAIENR